MKPKLLSLLFFSITSSAFATPPGYYSNGGQPVTPPSAPAGYYSTGGTTQQPVEQQKKEHSHFSFSINALPAVVPEPPYIINNDRHHHHHREPTWVNMASGYPLPSNVVAGGFQSYPPETLMVCRGNYHGGVHPGKLLEGLCHISWGGAEISLPQYQVLVSRAPLNWVAGNYGYVPPNAIQGGYENGGPLYVCQAEYRNGMHPGKLVGQRCNIGWGGREIALPHYNVLVR